ncbi:anhydro-N-acetylmuramic acid kinase [Ramlibacter sp. AN1015]|uniref:anhydro-N-acetylmuramic acid kinase n=1 Tax=Ramlibacter sp. AN1015 TaxID=3133428 RepID=UPI0030C008BB
MAAIYAGLMSGTSLDGVDGVLADFADGAIHVHAYASRDMPSALRSELLALNASGSDELHRAALAANALMEVYAGVVLDLLQRAGLRAAQVRAIGAHGQTVRHRPQEFDGTGYTIQLAQPALLAERTGIAVAADFRSRDVAAGGQGAPLAPFFHRAWLNRPGRTVGVLNIGGISNLTVLEPDGVLLGFDCGPGNALLDHWCLRHRGHAFDAEGTWAAQGCVRDDLLAALLAEPYFMRPPPKSTGRDLFHPLWLQERLAAAAPDAAPIDVQATLAELTARCCADAVRRQAPRLPELVVCGGGAYNLHLLRRLSALLPNTEVVASADRGLPPLQVEAAAFAWLASRLVEHVPLDLTSTTGARGARVLGCLYPA